MLYNSLRGTHHRLSCVSVVLSAVVQSDDPEGEIALVSCVNVSDCEVEKNHGFQIHVRNQREMFSY